jgi:hypothetical protein
VLTPWDWQRTRTAKMTSMTSDEEWRDIPGYEGLYQVSSWGRARSLDRVIHYSDGRVRKYTSQMLSAPIDSVGYPHVRLTNKDKFARTFRMHDLVALAFLPPKPSYDNPHVRHLNDDKSDNRVENLAWGTPAQNSADKFRNGYVQKRPDTCKRGHAFTHANTKVQPDGHRNCRECDRAYHWLRARGLPITEESRKHFFEEKGLKYTC